MELKRYEIELHHIQREVHDMAEEITKTRREIKVQILEHTEEVQKAHHDIQFEAKRQENIANMNDVRRGEIRRLRLEAGLELPAEP